MHQSNRDIAFLFFAMQRIGELKPLLVIEYSRSNLKRNFMLSDVRFVLALIPYK